MDDIKLFPKNEKELETFKQAVGMSHDYNKSRKQ